MCSVIAIRTKVRGLKPPRGDGFLRALKIRSTPSFGGEEKQEAPYHKISFESMNKNTSQSQINHSLRLFILLDTR
jgi:hypothetical protein